MLQASGTAVVKEQCAGLRIQPNHAKQKRQIANACRDECLLGCCRRTRLLIPEADQKIRRETHNLPTHEEQKQAV